MSVTEAGIVILPQPQYGEGGDSEADVEAFEFDRGVLKWPKKTVLLDTDMFDVEDSWHDTPPEDFSLTVCLCLLLLISALVQFLPCQNCFYSYQTLCFSFSVIIICNNVDGAVWMDDVFFFSLHIWA